VTATAAAEGLTVRLTGDGVYKLAGKRLSYRWELPDGSQVSAREVSWLFTRSGAFEVRLFAEADGTEHSRTVTIAAPTGPGDIGLQRWPEGIRLQAESFSAQGGGASVVKVRTPEEKLGSDGGSISHWDPLGAWMEWEVEVPRAESYLLLARYASPAANQRVLSLDGNEVGVLRLPLTGGYSGPATDDWRAELLRDDAGQPQAVAFGAGRHTLRLANSDGMGCNLDYVDLLPR
jgi:hypothetical protein